MILPVPGDSVLHIMENSINLIDDAEFKYSVTHDREAGDIPVGGWLTTEHKNRYDQVFHAKALDHPTGTKYWSGRVLNSHGRQFLVGGGDSTPIGVMTEHDLVPGSGLRAKGHIYREADPLVKRAIQDQTMNAWSIGFRILEDGAKIEKGKGKQTDTLHIWKAELHEVSTCNVGVNRNSFIELLHSLRPDNESLKHGYLYVICGGKRYLINKQGDIIDG